MAEKKNNTNTLNNARKKPKRSFLTIFICISLAIVLALGIVLGIVMTTKKANAAVSFDGVTMDKKVASFFVSRNKSMYIRFLRQTGVEGAEDTVAFWNTNSGEGKTYGELLDENTRNYIRWIIVTNYIFDSNYKLSKQDKLRISTTVEDTLNRIEIGGNEDTFNKIASKYGFTYSAFKKASEMLYKTAKVYNIDGSNLGSADIEAYMSDYTHVKLLFIRTESTFEVDENGNRIEGSDGYLMHTYTEDEKAAVAADIAEIRNAISLIGAGVDGAMGETMFNVFLDKYKNDGVASMVGSGYYFHDKESFTKVFKESYADIVKESYDMEIGEYSEVEYEYGVCFIYKTAPLTSDLGDKDLTDSCLYDFYSNAMMAFYDKTIPQIGKDVVFNKKFEEIDMIKIAYNSEFIPSF